MAKNNQANAGNLPAPAEQGEDLDKQLDGSQEDSDLLLEKTDTADSTDSAAAVDIVVTGFSEATVAPRRSIKLGGKIKGPGSIVILPDAEILSLRDHGFLLTLDAVLPAKAEGATFNVSNGPSVGGG